MKKKQPSGSGYKVFYTRIEQPWDSLNKDYDLVNNTSIVRILNSASHGRSLLAHDLIHARWSDLNKEVMKYGEHDHAAYKELISGVKKGLSEEVNTDLLRAIARRMNGKWVYDLDLLAEPEIVRNESFLNHWEMALGLVLPSKMQEAVLGDLEEQYRSNIMPKHGAVYGKLWYSVQALKLIGSSIPAGLLKALGLADLFRRIIGQ